MSSGLAFFTVLLALLPLPRQYEWLFLLSQYIAQLITRLTT
jgi:hypothetical protein